MSTVSVSNQLDTAPAAGHN